MEPYEIQISTVDNIINNDKIINHNIINKDISLSLEDSLSICSENRLDDGMIITSKSFISKDINREIDSDSEYATPNITPLVINLYPKTFDSPIKNYMNEPLTITRPYTTIPSNLISPRHSPSLPNSSKSFGFPKQHPAKIMKLDLNKLNSNTGTIPLPAILTSRQIEQNELLNGLLSSKVNLTIQTPPPDTTISSVNLNPFSNNNPTFKAPLTSREEPTYTKLSSNLKPSLSISKHKSNKVTENQYYSFDVNVNSVDIPTVENPIATKIIRKPSVSLPRPKSANVVQSNKELLKNYKNAKEELKPKKTVLKSNIVQIGCQ